MHEDYKVDMEEFISRLNIGPAIAWRIREMNKDGIFHGIRVRGLHRNKPSWRSLKKRGWREVEYKAVFR